MNRTGSVGQLSSDDLLALRRVLSRYPIWLGIVFGSQVRGDAHLTSDIDPAVEFDEANDGSKIDARSSLIADMASALGRNAVDVADLGAMRPAVGKAAVENGIALVGSSDRAERYREAFARTETVPNRTRGERFEGVLDRIEKLV
jgi:predicted nucleotidyltransferase